MMEFLSFVLFVFGVLQIILFFKLWGMTNDVRLLRKHFIDECQVKITDESQVTITDDAQYKIGETVFCISLNENGVIKGYDGKKYTVEFSDGGSAEIYPRDISSKSTISVGDHVVYTPMGAKCVVVAYDKLSGKYKLEADNGTTFNAGKEDIEKS